MSILGWVIIGGFAGWLASLVAGTGKKMGCILNIGAGIIGALVGGFIFTRLGESGVTGFNWWSLFVSFVGAAAFLMGLRLLALVFVGKRK